VSGVRDITGEIASFAHASNFEALPDVVQREAPRALLNWIGCAIGGSREPAVDAAVALMAEVGGPPRATIIGRATKTDVVEAAFINCLSSATLAYDDTHLATVTHPTGPVAAVLLAWSERARISGAEFLNALTLGIEVQCRLSNLLLLPPAKANLGLYITGITGPIGAAVALARLMRLDEAKMRAAIGIAATQAAGLRSTHASMAGAFPPAHAARAGMLATLLAAKGFACSPQTLEGSNGLVEVFAPGADLARVVEGIGGDFEMLRNAYKPYPSGIVVQPTIDACLDIAARLPASAQIAHVKLIVDPLANMLANRPTPKTVWDAQISLQHFAAAALLRRTVGTAETRQASVDDLAIATLRQRVDIVVDPALGRDAARAEVTLDDGASLDARVDVARGSAKRPMTDDELDAKFRSLAAVALHEDMVERLLRRCREAAKIDDVGPALAADLS
jgi:2-methylcitrate dehydratase PrpD